MTTAPVYYVEINSPDLAATNRFFGDVFDWEAQPFAAPDYLVAPHGDGPGVDAGLLASRDGNPRSVPVIRIESIDDVRPRLEAAGGAIVVEPFTIPGVGRGCYFTDPAGVLVGMHEYDPGVR
jgi:predicted enzyme related to lactoylglutathione lyase